jgi:hypothetical protein
MSETAAGREDPMTELFRRQLDLQRQTGSYPPAMTPDQRMRYVKDMILACEDELHEALQETEWKPWSTAPPGFKDRDKFAGEIRDALQFVINLLLAADVTPSELGAMLSAKWDVNHRRVEEGYDGRNKCDHCRRALDEPGIIEILTDKAGFRFCSGKCRDTFEE